MNTTTTTPAAQTVEPGTPLHWFLEVWRGDAAADIAKALTCTEADALAGLLRSCGRTAAALEWINAHACSDEEGDAHYRTPAETLRAEFDELAASVPGLDLCEEDPDTFGFGHLVFYKQNEDARIGFTEISDRPSDDPEREVTGYEWTADRRGSDGVSVVTASGSATLDDLDTITAAAWTWATQ